MKNFSRAIAVALSLVMLICIIPTGQVMAATSKSKVTYTLNKSGVLTIKGKGNMPKTMTFKNNKKVKKVVIKKGVTSISDNAFMDCKNLEKVSIAKSVKSIGTYAFYGTKIKSITIPSSVKTIGSSALMKCEKLKNITMPGKINVNRKSGDEEPDGFMKDGIKNVYFNSPLSLDTVAYCNTSNLHVYKKDKNYTSINGVIYSKDKTSIVRVPSERASLVIEEGCTTFPLSSIGYALSVSDYGDLACCDKLREITIASTVQNVNDTDYLTVNDLSYLEIEKITVRSDKLSYESIVKLVEEKKQDVVIDLLNQIKGMKKVNNMYIYNDKKLVKYVGNDKKVTIPDGVDEIASKAFACEYFSDNGKLNTVVIPDSVTKIGDEAFTYRKGLKKADLPSGLKSIGSKVFYECNLDKITVPGNLSTWGEAAFYKSGVKEVEILGDYTCIPKMTFEFCDRLKKINIPTSVTDIGESAFCFCESLDISNLLVGTNVTTIEDYAFFGAVGSKVTIPESVRKVGEWAFCREANQLKKNRTIYIHGDINKIDANAFDNKNTTLVYSKSNTKTPMDIIKLTTEKSGASTAKIRWAKVFGAGGYEVQFSSDKNFKKNLKKYKIKSSKTEYEKKVTFQSQRLYVRIRPYKVIDGKKIYGVWSKAFAYR